MTHAHERKRDGRSTGRTTTHADDDHGSWLAVAMRNGVENPADPHAGDDLPGGKGEEGGR